MGALQGIGIPTPYAAAPTPWANPWLSSSQMGYPLTQPFTPALSGSAIGAAFGAYPQQQLLQWLQVAVQQALHVVPLQLHQIQQLVQLLAQQQQLYPAPYGQGLQPFQTAVGQSPWFAGTQPSHAQPFGGQPGYVM